MWKKKLINVPTTLLRRCAPATRSPPTTYITFHGDSQQLSLLRSLSSHSYFPRFQSKKFFFSVSSLLSPARVRHVPSVLIGYHFCSSSISAVKSGCWNCNSQLSGTTPFLLCEKCGSVQPVDHSVDYFQIFGLEKNYVMEDKNLEMKYKNWQKKLHPDIVHTKSEKEREYAAEQSARITDAYRTLNDNLRRAIYTLKLEGVEVDEEETVSDPELLNEIMEIRETVEETTDSVKLTQILTGLVEKLSLLSGNLAKAFKNKKYEDCVDSIRRMKYYKRAWEEIVDKI